VAAVGERLASSGEARSTEESPQPIKYTMRTVPTTLNIKYTHSERYTSRFLDYYRRAPKSTIRAARRMQALSDRAHAVVETEWEAAWTDAELMADEEERAAEAKAAEDKFETFAAIAACDREFAKSFLAVHGDDLECAVDAFCEQTDARLLVAEADGLSHASSRLLLSASACSSDLASEAVAIDLGDVDSEWSEFAELEDLASLPSDSEHGIEYE